MEDIHLLQQSAVSRYFKDRVSRIGSMVMAGVKWLPVAFVAGVFLGSLPLTQSAAAATLTPASPTVIAGNSVTLTLNDTIAAAVPPTAGVGAVTLIVTYDQSLLTLVSVTDGSLLLNWDTPFFNATTGLVSISEGVNGDDAQGTGTVLTLTFTAKSADPTKSTSVVAQTATGARGVAGEYQLLATSDTINITAAPATPPATVPEPGTIALLLAPLVVAAGLTRRTRC